METTTKNNDNNDNDNDADLLSPLKPAAQRIKPALKKAPKMIAEESAEVEAALHSFLSQTKPFLGSLVLFGFAGSGQEARNLALLFVHSNPRFPVNVLESCSYAPHLIHRETVVKA